MRHPDPSSWLADDPEMVSDSCHSADHRHKYSLPPLLLYPGAAITIALPFHETVDT